MLTPGFELYLLSAKEWRKRIERTATLYYGYICSFVLGEQGISYGSLNAKASTTLNLNPTPI